MTDLEMTYEDVQRGLKKMHVAIRPGGVVAVLEPNFKYGAKNYVDCDDHILALTKVSVQEDLYAAEFYMRSTSSNCLTYSLGDRLPPSKILTYLYLRNPWAFRTLGKQFLLITAT